VTDGFGDTAFSDDPDAEGDGVGLEHVLPLVDADHRRHARMASFLVRLTVERWEEEGALSSLPLADVLRDFSFCPEDILQGALYAGDLDIVALDFGDQACMCAACRVLRTTMYLRLNFDSYAQSVLVRRAQENRAREADRRVAEARDTGGSFGFVYLVRAGDRFKIGVARDVPRRLAQLNSGQSPFPVQLVHAAAHADYRAAEAALHRRFADWRVHGEWFALDEERVGEVVRHMDEWRAAVSNGADPR
jgi:hypothetical protein